MKILGISGGMHSCGLAYLKDGKPIFAFEEERFNRIRTYKDFYEMFFRYPYESGQNVWFDKDFDWEDLDYMVLPYHWDDRNKLYKDYKYSITLMNTLMPIISKSLNSFSVKSSPNTRVLYSAFLFEPGKVQDIRNKNKNNIFILVL